MANFLSSKGKTKIKLYIKILYYKNDIISVRKDKLKIKPFLVFFTIRKH